MTDVACFCGCLYSFDGGEGPCPRCRAVAVVWTQASRETSGKREHSEPDAVTADASLPEGTVMLAPVRADAESWNVSAARTLNSPRSALRSTRFVK